MKLIVPTDFSPNARLAAMYASAIAQHSHSSILLFHAVAPVMASPGYQGVMADARIAQMNDAVETLREDIEDLKKLYPDVKFNYQISEGDVTDTIIRVSNEQSPDLVVMGTLGATGLKGLLFGSNTSKVIAESEVPVLTVPPDVKIKAPFKFVCATDYMNVELDAITRLSLFARAVDASTITFVHIIGEKNDIADEKDLMAEFRVEIGKMISFPNLNFQLFRSDDIVDGIMAFAKAIDADIVALTTHKREGLKRLFGDSVTKELAYRNMLPLLVYHEKFTTLPSDF